MNNVAILRNIIKKKYKGYSYAIEYCKKDKMFKTTIPLNLTLHAEGESIEEVITKMRNSIDKIKG